MFGLFGPRVPKTLQTDSDYAQLAAVLSTRSDGKIRDALALVEKAGGSARRAVPLVEPYLNQAAYAILAARALWRVSRSPQAAETILNALNTPDPPSDSDHSLRVLRQGEVLLAISLIAADDPTHVATLIEAAGRLLNTMAGAKGTGDAFDKVVNAFTDGDDNRAARYASAVLAEIAWNHPAVKEQLAAAVRNPKNKQQGKYAALALGFSCYADVALMQEKLGFMNIFFDHPSMAMTPARNKLRADALAAGLAYAKKADQGGV